LPILLSRAFRQDPCDPEERPQMLISVYVYIFISVYTHTHTHTHTHTDACNPEDRPQMLEEIQAPRRQRQKK